MLTVDPRRAGRPTSEDDLSRQDPACSAPRHGTASAYKYGCRCDRARNSHRLNAKRRREGRHVSPLTDATGSQRRIQAMAAMGWRYTDIAARFGCTWQTIQHLALGHNPKISVQKARQISDLFDEWWNQPGPSTRSATRARNKGWVTALAWDDDTIDDPNAKPQNPKPREHGIDHAAITLVVSGLANVPLSKPERQLAGQRMVAADIDAAIIVERLGVTAKTVAYHRAHQQQRVAA